MNPNSDSDECRFFITDNYIKHISKCFDFSFELREFYGRCTFYSWSNKHITKWQITIAIYAELSKKWMNVNINNICESLLH